MRSESSGKVFAVMLAVAFVVIGAGVTNGRTDDLTEQIIDCFGQTTHELTLDDDRTVTIRFATSGATARVHPSQRTVLTPGLAVPDAIMDLAAGLHPG